MLPRNCSYCYSAIPVAAIECGKCGAAATYTQSDDAQSYIPRPLVLALSVLIVCAGIALVLMSGKASKESPVSPIGVSGSTGSMSVTADKHYMKAMFTNAWVDLMIYQRAIEEHYSFEGSFPMTTQQFLEAIRLKGFDTGKYIRSIDIKDSALVAQLADPFAMDEYISLKPSVSTYGTRIEWQCKTNVDRSILDTYTGSNLTCEN